MPNKLVRFTQRARRVLSLAQEAAERMKHHQIDTGHFLLGLMGEEGGVSGRVLRDLGLDSRRVEEWVTRLPSAASQTSHPQLDLSLGSKKLLELAVDEARRMGHHYIGTEHLLLGFVRQEGDAALDMLRGLGVTPEEVRRQTLQVLQESPVLSSQEAQDQPQSKPSQVQKESIRVAVAQVASVFADKDACIEKAVGVIAEAGKQGADLIVLPEVVIPGYPRGFTYGAYVGNRSDAGRKDFERYWKSSMTLDARETRPLREAARAAGAYVVLGISERGEAGNRGTLYNTMLYLGPEGEILGKHRKLMPTGAERLIWGSGDGSTLTAVDSPYGTIGGLICWENYMPLARMAMYAKGVSIYAAPTADDRDSWQASLRHIACEGRCFVLGCNQYFTKSMYPADLALYAELQDLPEELCRGGSAIVDPFGAYEAPPLYGAEGVLYAELDLNKIHQAHLDFDVVGHYHRPDVFKFALNEAPNPILTVDD